MTPFRIAVFASIFTSTTLSLAANLPRNANVVVCQPNAGCIHHTIFGHDYRLLNSNRFAVMVFTIGKQDEHLMVLRLVLERFLRGIDGFGQSRSALGNGMGVE